MQRRHIPAAKLVLLIVFGAALATFGDAMHVRTGTLAYPRTWLLGQPAWSFPGFVAAFLAMAAIYVLSAKTLGRLLPTSTSTGPTPPRAYVTSALAFLFAYVLSAYGHDDPAMLAVILYGTFFVRWIFEDDRPWLLYMASVLAIGGIVGEGLIVLSGQVSCARPEVFHVPLWLGGLYMHGAVYLRESLRASWYADR